MRKIFLDVDDTLADFKAAAIACGVPAWHGSWYTTPKETWNEEQLEIDRITMEIMHREDFWRNIPVVSGAWKLIEVARSIGETYLLTATPRDMDADGKAMVARIKLQYGQDILGFPKDKIIVCERREKVQYASLQPTTWDRPVVQKTPILVDDATQNCAEWQAAGGIAIHHEGNIVHTMQMLATYR